MLHVGISLYDEGHCQVYENNMLDIMILTASPLVSDEMMRGERNELGLPDRCDRRDFSSRF